MSEIPDYGPHTALLRAAGWMPVENPDLLDIDIHEVIDRALNGIGLPDDERPPFRSAVHNWVLKSRFRPPSRGAQIEARQLAAAIKRLETALAEANKALTLIHNARAANIGVRTRRDLALEKVQKGILSTIANSVLGAIKVRYLPSVSEIDASMPSYEWDRYGFDMRNNWHGIFRAARDHVSRCRKECASSAFALTAHDKNPWRTILIQDLANLYQEATGKEPKSPERTASQPPNHRNRFQQFVVDLWPLLGAIGTDEADLRKQRAAPSNKEIRGALELRTK